LGLISPTGKGKGKGKRVYGYSQTMIEILLIFSLSAEPAFINQTAEPDFKVERKRSNKRRRKIRKPLKGLR